MNGPRVQVHRREGKRRSPDLGDLRAIYGVHSDRVPVTARPGDPGRPSRPGRHAGPRGQQAVTIISAAAGVAPGGSRGVLRGRVPATSTGELARSKRPGDRLAAGHLGPPRLPGETRAGFACWHHRALGVPEVLLLTRWQVGADPGRVTVHVALPGPAGTGMIHNWDIPRTARLLLPRRSSTEPQTAKKNLPGPRAATIEHGWHDGVIKTLEQRNAAAAQAVPVQA